MLFVGVCPALILAGLKCKVGGTKSLSSFLTFVLMRFTNTRMVSYRGRQYELRFEEVGGTAEQPALRGSDELLLNWVMEQDDQEAGNDSGSGSPAPEPEGSRRLNVFQDHSGLLTLILSRQTTNITTDCTTQDVLKTYWSLNEVVGDTPVCSSFLGEWEGAPLNLMRLPKSLDLFRLLLDRIARKATSETQLAVSFMTRHFSPRILEIAEAYAFSVDQSRAYKKARLLLLKDFKPVEELPQGDLHQLLPYDGFEYYQPFGVFSGQHIDYATQFLLDSWKTAPLLQTLPTPKRILDMGCGNGVIGHQLLLQYPEAQLAAFDRSLLAEAAARHNLLKLAGDASWEVYPAAGIPAHLEAFDLIVTNPPFHEGHRNSIDTSLALFKQAADKLKEGGKLVVVANRHLNYATQLRKWFKEVLIVAEQEKFLIYRCGQ